MIVLIILLLHIFVSCKYALVPLPLGTCNVAMLQSVN